MIKKTFLLSLMGLIFLSVAWGAQRKTGEKNLELFKAKMAEESDRDIASKSDLAHQNFLKKHKRLMKVQYWKTDKRGAY